MDGDALKTYHHKKAQLLKIFYFHIFTNQGRLVNCHKGQQVFVNLQMSTSLGKKPALPEFVKWPQCFRNKRNDHWLQTHPSIKYPTLWRCSGCGLLNVSCYLGWLWVEVWHLYRIKWGQQIYNFNDSVTSLTTFDRSFIVCLLICNLLFYSFCIKEEPVEECEDLLQDHWC